MRPPSHTVGPPPLPSPGSVSWRAFLAGYEAGIGHGIGIGRAQLEAEWAAVDAAARAGVRQAVAGGEAIARRDRYPSPALSGEDLIERARRSWAGPAAYPVRWPTSRATSPGRSPTRPPPSRRPGVRSTRPA